MRKETKGCIGLSALKVEFSWDDYAFRTVVDYRKMIYVFTVVTALKLEMKDSLSGISSSRSGFRAILIPSLLVQLIKCVNFCCQHKSNSSKNVKEAGTFRVVLTLMFFLLTYEIAAETMNQITFLKLRVLRKSCFRSVRINLLVSPSSQTTESEKTVWSAQRDNHIFCTNWNYFWLRLCQRIFAAKTETLVHWIINELVQNLRASKEKSFLQKTPTVKCKWRV